MVQTWVLELGMKSGVIVGGKDKLFMKITQHHGHVHCGSTSTCTCMSRTLQILEDREGKVELSPGCLTYLSLWRDVAMPLGIWLSIHPCIHLGMCIHLSNDNFLVGLMFVMKL